MRAGVPPPHARQEALLVMASVLELEERSAEYGELKKPAVYSLAKARRCSKKMPGNPYAKSTCGKPDSDRELGKVLLIELKHPPPQVRAF